MAEDTPALFDRVIDSSHRSFLAVVQRVKLNVLRPRPPAELIPVDPRWVPRWYVVGLCFWEYVCFVYVSYIMYLPLIILLFSRPGHLKPKNRNRTRTEPNRPNFRSIRFSVLKIKLFGFRCRFRFRSPETRIDSKNRNSSEWRI